MAGVKGMKMSNRTSGTVGVMIRVDSGMLEDLKLLYAYERKQYSMVSFNRWMVNKLAEALDKKRDILELVKGKLAEMEQRMNVV